MKAVILNGPNNFDVTELPKPEIGDGDILLEMKKAAICGTDMRILAGTKTKGVRYPSVIGHEMCGVIAEVGKDVKGYEVGEKVSIANVIPCGSCPACLAGRENACGRIQLKEAMIMARTANVFARVEPELKEQAESVLDQLGIPMSNAVGMFLRQIVLQKGIPFEMKLPRTAPLTYGSLTKEQFDKGIEKGMSDVKAGRVYSSEDNEAEMIRELGI